MLVVNKLLILRISLLVLNFEFDACVFRRTRIQLDYLLKFGWFLFFVYLLDFKGELASLGFGSWVGQIDVS